MTSFFVFIFRTIGERTVEEGIHRHLRATAAMCARADEQEEEHDC